MTWYDCVFESDFDVVDCTPFGLDFVVRDYLAGRESEAAYFDQAGNLIRSIYQAQGMHHLYLSTAPEVYLASGLLRDVQHVEILDLEPLLVRVRLTGTMWDVQVPGHQAAAIHWSGQLVEIIEGMPPDTNIVATLESVGRDAFDAQALCEALAGKSGKSTSEACPTLLGRVCSADPPLPSPEVIPTSVPAFTDCRVTPFCSG